MRKSLKKKKIFTNEEVKNIRPKSNPYPEIGGEETDSADGPKKLLYRI